MTKKIPFVRAAKFAKGDRVSVTLYCNPCGSGTVYTLRGTVTDQWTEGSVIVQLDRRPCKHRGLSQRIFVRDVRLISAVDLLADLVS